MATISLSQRYAAHSNNASYLCLKCRNLGHVVNNCPHPWPAQFFGQSWGFSEERAQLLQNLKGGNSQHELCRRCRDLDILSMLDGDLPWKTPATLRISNISDSNYYRNIGQAGSLVFHKDCPLCVCLFALTPSPVSSSEEVHVIADWTIHRLERLININSKAKRQYSKCILVDLSPPDGSIDLGEHIGDALCLLQSDQSDPATALSAKEISLTEIDVGLIEQYLSSCAKFHPYTCIPKKSKDLDDIWLVDVRSRKIVPYPGKNCDYISVSYVWGPVQQASYREGDILPNLPQTIEDAISLTQMLGKSYLWVDSLCINQRNKLHKAQQIRRMSSIYRGAYATIIAVSGHSVGSGLARINQNRAVQPQLTCSINGKRLLGTMPTLSQQIHNNNWGSRAWTLQEAILSHRCIYISDHQIYFECNAMQCSESLDETTSPIHKSFRGLREVRRGFNGDTFGSGTLRSSYIGDSDDEPSDPIQQYGVLATLYSFRQMTDMSDALYAFSGILDYLKDLSYHDGFFQGLPQADLNWALLWVPQTPHLERRPEFPSWSWTGWQGIIWPGWPIDIYNTQRFRTHFYAWKASEWPLVPVFPLHDRDQVGEELFSTPTIFDSVSRQPLPDDELDFSYFRSCETECQNALFIDCALCDIDFTFKDPSENWQFGPWTYHNVNVNGVACQLRANTGTLDHRQDVSGREVNLILTARERDREEIHHHFLQVEFQNDCEGSCRKVTRKGVFSLILSRSSPKALGVMSVQKRRLVLV